MAIEILGREIEIYTINTRTNLEEEYWRDLQTIIRLTDLHDFDGVLCFSANETLIEPWLAGHTVILSSRRLQPIVAVNPVTMHPFTAAKMISSFAYMHARRTVVNLITGTAPRDREVLGDPIAHDDRYERLTEFATIMRSLLTERRLTNFEGRFYRISQGALHPRLPESLHPRFLVGGHSEAAARTARAVDAVRLQMLSPQLEDGLLPIEGKRGIHFGVIARDQETDAWEAAHRRFPPDEDGEGILELSMSETDSVWKQQLYRQAREARETARPGFWLKPFSRFQGDCPYLIGAHARIAEVIRAHVARGIDWFVLDVPADATEFAHVAKAFELARRD